MWQAGRWLGTVPMVHKVVLGMRHNAGTEYLAVPEQREELTN